MDIMTQYGAIKVLHLICIVATITLFVARGIWVTVAGRSLGRAMRIIPHIVDTLLLASGLALAFMIHQYPFYNSGWLTAKVMGLIAYIGLGVMVFRGPDQGPWRSLSGGLAILVFGYIFSVALTKTPAGFLATMG